jgi:hypothetical protein
MKEKKNFLRKLLLAISAIIFIIIGSASPILYGWSRDNLLENDFEVPFQPSKIVIDKDGYIYAALNFYDRIQVYDNQGKFVFGRNVDAGMGAIDLKVGADNNLVAIAYRSRKLSVFNRQGALLSERKLSDEEVERSFKREGTVNTKYQYHLKWRLIYPIVTTKDPNGKEKVLIKNPIYFWLILYPFPGILFAICGGFVIWYWFLRKLIR